MAADSKRSFKSWKTKIVLKEGIRHITVNYEFDFVCNSISDGLP